MQVYEQEQKKRIRNLQEREKFHWCKSVLCIKYSLRLLAIYKFSPDIPFTFFTVVHGVLRKGERNFIKVQDLYLQMSSERGQSFL